MNVCGQPLTWSEITQGLTVGGEKILFANRARGIFKPARLQLGVLSVKTTVPRSGRGARYADIHDDKGSFTYRLQGSDPNAHDNRRLHESYEDQSPLIYFFGVSETRYEAIWPVFVTAWNPESLSVQIEVGTRLSLSSIHHAAFDAHLLGVDPDGVIAVSDRLLAMRDGPLLEQGLKGIAGDRIHFPQRKVDWPDRDLLAMRYDQFRKSN